MADFDFHGLSALTLLVFALHIAGGSVGLVSGTVAAIAEKGGRVHRAAGNIFFWSMSVMAASALYLGVVRPGQLVNVFISIFAFYLIGTGWLTVKRPPRRTRHDGEIRIGHRDHPVRAVSGSVV